MRLYIALTLAVLTVTRVQSAAAATTKPKAPTNLSAVATSQTQINLTWTDNSTIEVGYKIERATSSAGPWTQLATAARNATGYINTGLAEATTYYYRVRAYSRSANSDYSNTASATTAGTTTPPAAPSNLALSVISSAQINLAWTDNSNNETGFNIERALDRAGPWTSIALTAANATSFYNTGLLPNTYYYYRVSATNSAGSSAVSTAVGTRTLTSAVSVVTSPRGIYLLDDKSGPNRLGSISSANKPFIDGFVWRMHWKSFDTGTTGSNYNFTAFNDAISKLQALSNNQNNRMKLTLALFAQEVPAYVLASAAETYTAVGVGGTSVTAPAPWDANALAHYRSFIHAMAEYKVYDAVSKTYIALRDHPALGQVDAPILGMQSYRDRGGTTPADLASYDRDKFIEAILASIHIVRDEFPNKPVYVGFFSMNDNTRTPSLDSEVLAAVTGEFNGVTHPRIGLFQELLRGDAPSLLGDYGKNLLAGRAGGCYIMFQACSPWINKSLCTFTAGDDTPENGFNHGYLNYGALYYEMYLADLTNSAWTTMFQEWHDFLRALP